MSSALTLSVERLSDTEALLTASGIFAPTTPALRGGRVYLVAPFAQITDGLATLSDNTLATQRPSTLTAADTFANTFRANGQTVKVLRLTFNVNHVQGDTISGKVRLTLPPGNSLFTVGSQGEVWYGSDNNANLLTRTGTWQIVSPAATRPAIFFTSMEAKKVLRLGSDGTLTDVIQCAEIPRGVAVDKAGGKVYWSESWAHRIKRANLDGSGEEVIANTSSNVYSQPLDLELDLTNQKIYWTDPGMKRLVRADLNGANQQQVTKCGAALGLAIDLDHGKAYVGEGAGLSPQRIFSVNLDGSGMTVLFDTAVLPNRDLMDLEVAGDKLYWINGQEIEQCNLDGSGRAVLVSGLQDPRGLEIDRAAGKAYWTEEGKIRRAGLDGSGLETVYTLTSSSGLEHLALV